jgi:hypothetical protein
VSEITAAAATLENVRRWKQALGQIDDSSPIARQSLVELHRAHWDLFDRMKELGRSLSLCGSNEREAREHLRLMLAIDEELRSDTFRVEDLRGRAQFAAFWRSLQCSRPAPAP